MAPASRIRPRLRLGSLRGRMVVSFALASFIAALLLSIVTYATTRSYLLDQATTSARAQTIANAQLVRTLVGADREGADEVITNVRTSTGGYAVLHLAPESLFYAQAPLRFTQSNLPTSLVREVLGGSAARQRFTFNDAPYEGFGVPIPAIGAHYFEAFSLSTADATLGTVRNTLLVGIVVIALIAGLVGGTFSGAALAPLRRVSVAARNIASGGLDTRLEPENDDELNKLVDSFNEMADAVQDRIEREERFASDVSHELRSPITSLGAAVDVLAARRDELSERNQKAVDIITTQVRRFDRTVLDLLELSRLDAGAGQDQREEEHLGPLVERIAARFGYADVLVINEVGDDDVVVVDRRRVERILVNLLDNARDHAGGPVQVIIAPDDGNVLLMVDDGGPGIAVSERDRIFERFARGTASRNSTGSGLGLAIVSEHARAMRGRAWVDTAPSGGARFVVSIPRDAARGEE